MKAVKLCIFLLCFAASCVSAQVVLPYAINTAGLPADTASITFSQLNTGLKPGAFATAGLQEKEMAPDFVLYDTAGAPCQMSKLLAEGKPVLLMAVSYTCPQSRQNIEIRFRELQKRFGEKVNMRMIYIIEAHPEAPGVCPYSQETFNPDANVRDSIFFPQPKTYGERKKLAAAFTRNLKINVPVLIDSPENAWWLTYGPAPNNAYLITPSGMVYKKYAWLANPNFGTDMMVLLRDETAMKANTGNYIYIEKSGPRTTLYVNYSQYSIDIFNASGKSVHKAQNLNAAQYDLGKLKLKPGTYGVVVKTAEGYSYCVRYVL